MNVLDWTNFEQDLYERQLRIEKSFGDDICKGYKYLRKERSKNGKVVYIYKDNLIKRLNIVENAIVKKDKEHCFCFNENGDVLFTQEGEPNKIDIKEENVPKLKGSIFTHNHPGYKNYEKDIIYKTGISLSVPDITLACLNNVKEMRCVSGEYIYSFKKNDNSAFNFVDFLLLHANLVKIDYEVDKDCILMYKKGVNNKVLNAMNAHLKNKKIAKLLNVEYKKVKL
jgi:hypothetical protein